MVASRQILIHQQEQSNEVEHNNMRVHMDAPRLFTLAVCCSVVYQVYASQGVGLGILSGALTVICVSPLFTSSGERSGQEVQEDRSGEIQSSHIFQEALAHEVEDVREEEYSPFESMLQQMIDLLSEDIEELIYVSRVLRENQGLLILLVGGILSMMMAVIAGLDDVNVVKALTLSVTCYAITTVLVARSARRVVIQHNMPDNGEAKQLSSSDVAKIVDAIPEEKFVLHDELEHCDLVCIENMLHHRKITGSDRANTCTENDGISHQEFFATKEVLIEELLQRRNYNESCCICLCTFIQGERIRVLPGCNHEFHRNCIDEWAGTFAASRRISCNAKRGRPTCPLCNTRLGEAQACASSMSSQS